jgi:hypothetical protein
MHTPQEPWSSRWRKSSHSTAGNNCVEVAQAGTAVGVRDSKNPAAGHLTFSGNDWGKFLADVKHGACDL